MPFYFYYARLMPCTARVNLTPFGWTQSCKFKLYLFQARRGERNILLFLYIFLVISVVDIVEY